MQPFQINVQINIGVNDELYGLLSPLVKHLQVAPEKSKAAAPKKPKTPATQTEVENSPVPVETPETEATPEHQPETPAGTEQETKEYTEVDVRAAMDRTRKRIEGENYKEQTDSEGHKKWHRPLTSWFKNTAAVCGAEKPSALPDSESRGKFIRCCDSVYVKNDELTEDCPF